MRIATDAPNNPLIQFTRFADELGIIDEAQPGPNLFNLAAGVANALAGGGPFAGLGAGAESHPIMWTGSARPPRRRATGMSAVSETIYCAHLEIS